MLRKKGLIIFQLPDKKYQRSNEDQRPQEYLEVACWWCDPDTLQSFCNQWVIHIVSDKKIAQNDSRFYQLLFLYPIPFMAMFLSLDPLKVISMGVPRLFSRDWGKHFPGGAKTYFLPKNTKKRTIFLKKSPKHTIFNRGGGGMSPTLPSP